MKKLSIIFFAFVAIVACTVEPVPQDNPLLDKWLDIVTKAEAKTDSEFFVGEADIMNYAHYVYLKGLSNDEEIKIESITPYYFNGQICMYVLQYSKGFEIISADKRSPIPLVYNSKERIDLEKSNEAFRSHLDCIAEDVWASLNNPKLYENLDDESLKNIQSSITFWYLVNADSLYIEQHGIPVERLSPGDVPILPEDPPYPGHWDVCLRDVDTVVVDSIPHLVQTHWSQSFPFCDYCPHDIHDGVIYQCPAGCVAVAAAQVMYFLHGAINAPESSPSYGYCSGSVNLGYSQYFSDYSSETWQDMYPTTDPNHYAAYLIGDIGKRLPTSYHYNGSLAFTSHLPDSVFTPYGVNSRYRGPGYYDRDTLVNQLLIGFPVICGGQYMVRSNEYEGHTFIIDSYMRTQVVQTFVYDWVYDYPYNNLILPFIPRRIEVTYTTPVVTHYRMNWGYGIDPNDDTWCLVSGVWQYPNDPPYTYNREMVYGFSKISNQQ